MLEINREKYELLLSKITDGVIGAFEGPPEQQIDALTLLTELYERAEKVIAVLHD